MDTRAAWGLGLLLWIAPAQAELRGRVVDAQTLEPVGGAWVEARPDSGGLGRAYTDSAGWFLLDELPGGPCRLEVERLGYERALIQVAAAGEVEIRLLAQPLVLEGMVVRARRAGEDRAPAFVEVIRLEEQGAAVSLPELLERAAGVEVRRQGGLGSFSTLSIRGSTAEQVQVYLDGVPLNQAMGGGVDLGRLPAGGIESVEIYRGAVPARLGGNSLGGVVQLRTRGAAQRPQFRFQGMAGSFGTWQASGTASGPWRGGNYLGLVEGTASRNDFSFLDDNGTPYNPADDEWTRRRNSDFFGLRALLKAERPWGKARLQAHNTLDLKHQGIPGIGNFQAEKVRFDTWQDIAEVALSGPAGAAAGYRLAAWHLLQLDEYKDLLGEVGTGLQRTGNTTRSAGTQAELHLLAGQQVLATVFARGSREVFSPEDLLRSAAALGANRRHNLLLGGEGEVEVGDGRGVVVVGGQTQFIADARAAPVRPVVSGAGRTNTQVLSGGRLGGQWRLGGGWALQGHIGRYQRPPSFYELFGDRGAVIGNTELRSETGVHGDAGVVCRPAAGRLRLLEVAAYRKQIDELIRFVQNSQQVSRPHNIGRAVIQGIEARAALRAHRVDLSGNYVYQQAINRSAFPFERGRELPNAPRHALNLRAALNAGGGELYYELSCESRHFLDRANLRPVARRTLHTLGGALRRGGGLELAAEIRNLTGNQVADLWGYPLPGRAFFLTIRKALSISH